jgi:hypothetical protein
MYLWSAGFAQLAPGQVVLTVSDWEATAHYALARNGCIQWEP